MSDQIDRAAKAIHNACSISPALALEVARALDAAGLLVTDDPRPVVVLGGVGYGGEEGL